MNPAIHWPIGASPQMPMLQAHDTALLEGELARGEQTALELFQYIVVRLAMVAVGLQCTVVMLTCTHAAKLHRP